VECAANLGALPAAGATIVMGGPKIKGATGGPSRVIALA
jgi:kynurenine formamidase